MNKAVLVKEPLRYETCEGCGKDIIRNLCSLDGKPYHFGCLKKTKAGPTHYCLDCYTYLTGANVVRAYYPGRSRPVLTCGFCGSPNLRSSRRWRGR